MNAVRNIVVVAALVWACVPASAQAADITVTSAADSGPGTIRQAIADAAVSGDRIIVPDPQTLLLPAPEYTLVSQLLVLNKSLTITGAGADRVTIDADAKGRAFNIVRTTTTTDVTLEGITITGGKVIGLSDGYGGGIHSGPNTVLTVVDSAVVGNTVDVPGEAGFGGGIAAEGRLTMRRSLVASNVARNNSNAVTGVGGGIWVTAIANISASTVTGNTMTSTAGGLTAGGGVGASSPSASVGIVLSTIAGNTATTGGNLAKLGTGSVDVYQSIVADGTAGAGALNCSGAITDNGNSVYDVSNATGGCAPSAGSTIGDPQLEALADNGGPTQTRRIPATSPARDKNASLSCVAINLDQRGISRHQFTQCDAGAYEAAPPVLAASDPRGVTATTATVVANLAAQGPGGTWTLRYGPEGGAGLAANTVGPVAYDPGASTPVEIAAALTGLSSSTTYLYEFTVAGPDGTVTGQTLTFRTADLAPGAATGAASSITQTSATLSGTIDAQGIDTRYTFLLGTDPAALAPVTDRAAGSARGATAVSETVAGLTPGRTYTYRLSATNAGGTTLGDIGSFTTAAATGAPTPTPTPTPATSRALTLTKLTLKSFRRNAKKAKITFTLAGGTGTATVRFTLEKKNKRKTFSALKGSFSKRFTKNGTLSYSWSTRLRGKRLAVGSYRLVAVATPSTGKRTRPVRRAFSVRR